VEEKNGRTIWQQEFAALMGRLKPRFAHSQSRAWAAAYVQGLLSQVQRKNGWQLAESVGAATPYGIQQFLYRAKWNPDDIRDDLRAYVVEHLGEPEAVLVIDETGFVKKGPHSVGVQVQYCGTVGRTTNCQVGVFLAYASAKGATFLDRALYLPESWTSDRPRCRKVLGRLGDSLRFWSRCRRTIEHPFGTNVFIYIRPMDSVTIPNNLIISPLFRRGFAQSPRPD
jgi:SRSO17 transposase